MLQSGERVVRIDREGKPSLTLFRVIERFAEATLVEAIPKTGRTHQIRVHAASLGSPIAGDEKYGDALFSQQMRAFGVKRLFLHAAQLSFVLPPEAQQIIVTAPLEHGLEMALDKLRKTGAGSGT